MNRPALLLHICCAPDACVPWPELIEDGYAVCGYFYGGNIHPEEEFNRRAEAVRTLADAAAAPLLPALYDPKPWFDAVRGLESEPERGLRCRRCIALQLEETAKAAANGGFTHLCTTLTISPHKDAAYINKTGAETAARHGLIWLEKIWRKNDGFKRSVDESRRLGLYRQNYCGCLFSMRKAEPPAQ
ncbi:MAG: epoxyqueuosine reductase QueH [Cloacibacillus sp.]